MTYLELVNNVLIRLREETIAAGLLDSNPFYRSIGAHVNDAKTRVEDAWQWSGLRGTDTQSLVPSTTGVQTLPNSTDGSYILQRMYVRQIGESQLYPMRQVTVDKMRDNYMSGNVDAGQPFEFAITGREAATGSLEITMFPPPEADVSVGPAEPLWELVIDRVVRQATLTAADTLLWVPSLPVYTLATALASRERGEVGGAPTSELFGLADYALSDAIAQDSARYPYETDWYGGVSYPSNTNVGNY